MNTHYNYSANKGGPKLSIEPSKNTMNAIRFKLRFVNASVIHIKKKWKALPLVQKLIVAAVAAGILVWFYYYLKSVYNKKKIMGTPFLTGIKKNVPYNASNKNKIISSDNLEVDNEGVYTYSFWIYVNGFNQGFERDNLPTWETYRYGEWKHIMHRGTPLINSNGSPMPNDNLLQFPGFWLTPKLNNFVTIFQNGDQIERLELNDIEMNIWVNFTLVIEHYSISIYRDGKLLKTLVLKQKLVPVQNKNMYITYDGKNNDKSGFPGYLSFLVYYNKALEPNEVNLLYKSYLGYINRYKKFIDKKLWHNANSPGLVTNSDISEELS